MRMSTLLVLVVALVFLAGCAAFKTTVKDIKNDPGTFVSEAGEVTTAVNNLSPVPTGAAGVAVGYVIAFLRRMYVNYKKEQAIALAELKGTSTG